MSVIDEALAKVETFLGSSVPDQGAISRLRQSLQGVTLTRCDPSDLENETPFRSFDNYQLFLVDGRNHCWQITADLECATGIVLVPQAAQK